MESRLIHSLQDKLTTSFILFVLLSFIIILLLYYFIYYMYYYVVIIKFNYFLNNCQHLRVERGHIKSAFLASLEALGNLATEGLNPPQ